MSSSTNKPAKRFLEKKKFTLSLFSPLFLLRFLEGNKKMKNFVWDYSNSDYITWFLISGRCGLLHLSPLGLRMVTMDLVRWSHKSIRKIADLGRVYLSTLGKSNFLPYSIHKFEIKKQSCIRKLWKSGILFFMSILSWFALNKRFNVKGFSIRNAFKTFLKHIDIK